jgi:hypothetical protein
VRVNVRCELSRDGILKNLKGGNFHVSNSYVQLRSDVAPGWLKLNAIGAGCRAYRLARDLRNRLATMR